jgi:hypothetical protein
MTTPAARAQQTWTRADVLALGVQTDLRTAGAIFGYSATQAYEAAKHDRLPFPVIRCGIRYVVPVQPILELLGISDPSGLDDSSQAPDLGRSADGAQGLRPVPAAGTP